MKTATRKMTYGVSTTERSKDGFHVEIVASRLNIGEGFDPGRRACTVIELREAADKLNAYDDLVKALDRLIFVAEKLGADQDEGGALSQARAVLAKAGAV